LVYDIWVFYSDKTIHGIHTKTLERNGINIKVFEPKCTYDFLNAFSQTYKELDTGYPIQPWRIARICDKLCEHRFLRKFETPGFNNSDYESNFYYGYGKQEGTNKQVLSNIFNSIVYGFRYIYEYNKNNVLPIFVKKGDEQYTGTCFKTVYGIVTAKHCISNCDSIKIGDIDNRIFNDSIILTKDDLDLVVIKPNTEYHWEKCLLTKDGFVLDEVMVMGYPKHCGFENFITATMGSVAAIERSYLTKYDLMLLTGKLKGGNSGGPVINESGYVVGIVTEASAPEGGIYDQFGYGLAMPQYYINEILKDGKKFTDPAIFI
jgi:hypothetical protein